MKIGSFMQTTQLRKQTVPDQSQKITEIFKLGDTTWLILLLCMSITQRVIPVRVSKETI